MHDDYHFDDSPTILKGRKKHKGISINNTKNNYKNNMIIFYVMILLLCYE